MTFATIIDGYVKKGHLASAEEMLDKMKLFNLNPDVVTFTKIIDGHVKEGDLAYAEEMLSCLIWIQM